MTTKPKRKGPAAKRTAPKAAAQQASSEPKQTISEISRLVTRWRFLEAEEAYHAAIAETDKESETLICRHEDEQDEIEMDLSRSIPQDFYEVRELLEHAINLMDGGLLTNWADFMMLKNVLESLPDVFENTKEAERKETAMEMRDGLGALLDIFHKPGHLRILRDALERGMAPP